MGDNVILFLITELFIINKFFSENNSKFVISEIKTMSGKSMHPSDANLCYKLNK